MPCTLPEESSRQTVNENGLFDLGKVGCAKERFLASFEKLHKARDNGCARVAGDEVRVKQAAEYAFAHAVVALVAVNLLGLAFVAVRAVVWWITAGYTPARNGVATRATTCDAACRCPALSRLPACGRCRAGSWTSQRRPDAAVRCLMLPASNAVEA